MAEKKVIQALLFCLFLQNFVFDVVGAEDLSVEIKTYIQQLRERKENSKMFCPASQFDVRVSLKRLHPVISRKEAVLTVLQMGLENDIELPIPKGIQLQKNTTGEKILTKSTESMITLDPNVNTQLILERGQVYHAPQGLNVEGDLFIEPGAILKMGESTDFIVRNGGQLICIGRPLEWIAIIPDSSNAYRGYWNGITIEETASSGCRINYTLINSAYAGLWIDNRQLVKSIQHNFIESGVYGIVEFGTSHTEISNNVLYDIGGYSWDGSQWVIVGAGIECWHESYSGEEKAGTEITITQNTCYDNVIGIKVHGVTQQNKQGMTWLENNISAASWEYNFSLVDQYMIGIVINNGRWLYYDGSANKNWDFPEENPVEVFNNPFIHGLGYYDMVCLEPQCGFIDKGEEYTLNTEYVGSSCLVNGVPDSGKIDLGYHSYLNWHKSTAGLSSIAADFSDNLTVGIEDIAYFSDYWLFDYRIADQIRQMDKDGSGSIDIGDLGMFAEKWLIDYNMVDFAEFAAVWMTNVDSRLYDSSADLYADLQVDLKDFAEFAGMWGMTGVRDPNVQMNLYPDTSWGVFTVRPTGQSSDTDYMTLLCDGHMVGSFFKLYDWSDVAADLSEFGKGPHELKIVSSHTDGRITLSNVRVQNNLSFEYCVSPDNYHGNEQMHFFAKSGTSTITVTAVDDIGYNVWSQVYPGGIANGAVPATITDLYDIGYVSFTSSSGSVAKPTEKNKTGSIRALVILPDYKLNIVGMATNSLVMDTFKACGIRYKKLSRWWATGKRIAKYAANNNIDYIYCSAHGDYSIGGKLRTVVQLADGLYVSIKISDFQEPSNAPIWLKESLGGQFEETTKSVYSLGFDDDLVYVYFDFCDSSKLYINGSHQLVVGREGMDGMYDGPESDITYALGMHSTGIYQGWYDDITRSDSSPYSWFTQWEWGDDGLAGGNTIYTSLLYAINRSRGEVLDNIRIKGFGDIFTTKLR